MVVSIQFVKSTKLGEIELKVSNITEYLVDFKNVFWSGPLLFLLIGIGAYLSWRLRGLQLRYLVHSIRLVFFPRNSKVIEVGARNDRQLSSFQSLMTGLAGAVGTGNITGIAIALSIGGYGALFWMWVIAIFGMVTAYAEALLSIKYRNQSGRGVFGSLGGPMHTLVNGLGMKKTAVAFCFLCILASFGIGGTVQSNSVAAGLYEVFSIDPKLTGFIMSLLTGCVVLGGLKSIGKAAGILVPVMGLLYLGAGVVVLIVHRQYLGEAFFLIFKGAFSGQAASGAFIGSSAVAAVQQGVSNGIFANEAGLGSLALAAGTADTQKPAKQGMLAICGVFVATMLICTITGLTIAVTQVLGTSSSDGSLLTGSALTIAAFSKVFPSFGYIVVVGLVFFAFTTVLAWAYYGEVCLSFLFGAKTAKYYRVIYTLAVFLGVFIEPHLVWALANLANGFMAVPNLISIFRLVPVVEQETQDYLASLRGQVSTTEIMACQLRNPSAGSASQ